jgi:hypothetical protein
MPFGLSNALTTFQVVMNDLFHPHLRKFVLVFFDDILVYSRNWNLHLKHIETVLKLLEENKFYANKSKCSFIRREIEFLGHVVSIEGIKVDQRILKQLLSGLLQKYHIFMRILGSYRILQKIHKNYAENVAPLITLLKKDTFRWNDATETYFKKMKAFYDFNPILASPDFTKTFVLECDL